MCDHYYCACPECDGTDSEPITLEDVVADMTSDYLEAIELEREPVWAHMDYLLDNPSGDAWRMWEWEW